MNVPVFIVPLSLGAPESLLDIAERETPESSAASPTCKQGVISSGQGMCGPLGSALFDRILVPGVACMKHAERPTLTVFEMGAWAAAAWAIACWIEAGK